MLAHRLAAAMAEVEGTDIPTGALDITMYRDDLRRHPTRAVGRTHLPVEIDDAVVVLVDDVLYSGPYGAGRAGRPRRSRSARERSGWPYSSIADTANCRSAPTTSARTCRPRPASGSASG